MSDVYWRVSLNCFRVVVSLWLKIICTFIEKKNQEQLKHHIYILFFIQSNSKTAVYIRVHTCIYLKDHMFSTCFYCMIQCMAWQKHFLWSLKKQNKNASLYEQIITTALQSDSKLKIEVFLSKLYKSVSKYGTYS